MNNWANQWRQYLQKHSQDKKGILSQHTTPSLNVSQCEKGPLATIKGFKLPQGNAEFPAETIVELCWEQDYM